jgi:anaphase-promoting complex subunit 1
MQWLEDMQLRVRGGLEHPIADMEWSAVTILLLASFLVLGHNSETSLRTLGTETIRPLAKSKYEVMQLRESWNSSACPPWMRSKAWQWMLDSVVEASSTRNEEAWPSRGFISFHVSLAKRWMASEGGLSAFGFEGYLPTTLSRIGNPRDMAAWSMFLALHLLIEEQKLDVISSEDTSPGPSDLKAILFQLSKWLGWQRYEAIYALGAQAEPTSAQDLGTFSLVSAHMALNY